MTDESPMDILTNDARQRAVAVTAAAAVLRRSPGFGRSETANAYEVISLAEYILTGRWGEDAVDLRVDDTPLPDSIELP